MTENETIQDPKAIRRVNYNRLVRQAKLVSLLLEDLDFHVSPEALTVEKKQLKRSLGSEVVNFAFQPDEDFVVANIRWKISIRDKRKLLVKCSAIYSVIYENIRDCEEDVARIFVEHVAAGATYAYFRALFAQLDWSSGLYSPPLPALRLEPPV